jgi:hypothetical protein
VCTPGGLPVAVALTGARAAEREVLLVAARPGQVLLADKNHDGGQFERMLGALGLRLLRPARRGEAERQGAGLFRPLRQLVESVSQTFKGQPDLERHGGRTGIGVAVEPIVECRSRQLLFREPSPGPLSAYYLNSWLPYDGLVGVTILATIQTAD